MTCRSRLCIRSLFFAAWVGWAVFASVSAPATAQSPDKAAADLMARYRSELVDLAAWCDQQGLAPQAQQTRAWIAPRDPGKLYVAMLVDEVGSDKPPADADDKVLDWHARLSQLRRKQAQAMFQLAQRAVRAGRASLGLDLVLAAVREDPDNEAIRSLLGFQQYKGRWCTQYEIQNLRAGKVWHEKFGWLPAGHVPRYEKGERYFRGRWISAEEDARLHQDIGHGWDIETEHYTIRTDHSIEAGVRLGAKLEQLYRVWKQLFFRYFATEAQLAELFRNDGRTRARPAGNLPRHEVFYYRDRDEYNRSLEQVISGVGVSVGVYFGGTSRAYFFAGEGSDERTLLHEATHQLFHESRRVSPDVGRLNNFWIIEGIAMYMESLRQEDGYHVLGGFDDPRLHAARYRLINDNFYVPLAEFCSYGMETLQQDRRIAMLYSQAAGLTHFLIHYDGGRYRDQLVAYLVAVYNGQTTAGTLSQLTGTSYGDLDGQYRQFMESAP
jgi:hypothetical protein